MVDVAYDEKKIVLGVNNNLNKPLIFTRNKKKHYKAVSEENIQ